VRFLHAQGHRKIAHLTARGDPRARRRHAGYQRQMDEFGLSTKGLVGATPHISDVAVGCELFAQILEQVPDVSAVFTCNDDLALGTLFECQRRGIMVPDELAIIGFNDLDFAMASWPPLTSVSTERREMGTWSARAILEIIRGGGKRPKQPRVDVGFSIKARGSTGPTVAPKPKKAKAKSKA
jgi:LacI family gluconate utilization system Gnt-I transcriptional repressor